MRGGAGGYHQGGETGNASPGESQGGWPALIKIFVFSRANGPGPKTGPVQRDHPTAVQQANGVQHKGPERTIPNFARRK